MSIENKSLESLKSEMDLLNKQRQKLRAKIEKAEQIELMPDIRKRAEGKYFKYRNSAGSDTEKWWLYSYCIKMLTPNEGLFNVFESSPYENTFKVRKEEFTHLCQVQIRKAEYLKALRLFIKKVSKLNTDLISK